MFSIFKKSTPTQQEFAEQRLAETRLAILDAEDQVERLICQLRDAEAIVEILHSREDRLAQYVTPSEELDFDQFKVGGSL